MKDNPKIKEEAEKCRQILKDIINNKDLNNTELGFFVEEIIIGLNENNKPIIKEIKLNLPQIDSEVLSSCDDMTLWLKLFIRTIDTLNYNR